MRYLTGPGKDYDMTKKYLAFTFAMTWLMGLGHPVLAADVIRGQALYQSMCASCHSIEYNGVGPAHKGLFNRKAGSLTDYAYSPALKSSEVVWNEKTLDKWLANPAKMIPGEKMGYKVPSAKDRADLIEYLKQSTAPQ
jgi:cytochrome c